MSVVLCFMLNINFHAAGRKVKETKCPVGKIFFSNWKNNFLQLGKYFYDVFYRKRPVLTKTNLSCMYFTSCPYGRGTKAVHQR